MIMATVQRILHHAFASQMSQPQPEPELKMWLAVRTDLPLSRGKLAVQAMHAAGWLHLVVARDNPQLLERYLADAMPKISVRVDTAAALDRVEAEAKQAGIPCFVVTDAGRSEVEPGTRTVCLFGPAYRDDLPAFLKRLQTLKDKE
ncbi:peptidyl-tRNA hydrolase PTH2 family protein (plasmid) [Bosea sp. RAC05]|nr:peptidyl-tRNA hydrolase PTH2 family protein [Bosea sp. RAC05]